MKRKYPDIDILELYSKANHQKWNKFLAGCEIKDDLLSLERTLYGLQGGMDTLVKKQMSHDKIVHWFIRIQRSLEISMQNIIRKRDPNPLDNPKNKKDWKHKITEKRQRDHEIHKHIRKNSF